MALKCFLSLFFCLEEVLERRKRKMDLFLYDYTTMGSEVLVFGYDAHGRKCEVYLSGFSINCHLVIDTCYFDSAVALHAALEQIHY